MLFLCFLPDLFGGIEVDTVSFQLRFPKDQLVNLKDSSSGMVECRTITKNDLRSLAIRYQGSAPG